MTCPSADTLAALHTLDQSERGRIVDHATTCEMCRAALAMDETAAADSADIPVSSEPDQIGRYRIERRLGAGAMGVVYAAYDSELDRRIALKLMKPQASADRLRREAQTLAKLTHANIVTVHDVGMHDGAAFVAMELVDGENLRSWLQKPRTTTEILDKLVQASRGIIAAHAEGVIHRDLKPDNIFVSARGEVLVGDFGLARSSGPPSGDIPVSDLTATGAIMGTPVYMPPESFTGEATALSDQFSLCVTMWEALYGARPFQGATIDELLASIKRGPPSPRRKISPRIHAAIVRGLSLEPTQRFPSVAALVAEITRRRKRWPFVAAALAAVAIAGGAYAVTRPDPKQLAIAACDRDRDRTLHWSGERRAINAAQMIGHFPVAGPAIAAQANCDATNWLDVAHEACRANAEQRLSNPEHAALARCLERRARMFNIVIDNIHLSVNPLNARVQLDEVGTPERCRGLAMDVSPSPALLALQVDLDLHRVMSGLSADPSGDAERAALLRRAMDSGDLQVQAEVEASIGEELVRLERPSDAEVHLRSAIALADRAHDDRLRALVGAQLATVLAQSGRVSEATVLRDGAASAADRAHDAPAKLAVEEASIQLLLRAGASPAALVAPTRKMIELGAGRCGPSVAVDQLKIALAFRLAYAADPQRPPRSPRRAR